MSGAATHSEPSRRVGLLSRISVRLMLFNVLLVFLPIAGILYLGIYEDRLVERRMASLHDQAEMLAAALGGAEWIDGARARGMFARITDASDEETTRLRVVLPSGVVVADSRPRLLIDRDAAREEERIRANWLYRAGSSVGRPLLRILRAEEPELQGGESLERSGLVRGPEVSSALAGIPARSKRMAPDRRSVTLYATSPVHGRGGIIGVVVASDTTRGILRDLYTIRLGILRIFFASLLVAVLVTLVIGTTIVRPIQSLRRDALEISERRERIGRTFTGSSRPDEIGDLARALEALTQRLDAHVGFLEAFATDVSHEIKNPLASIRSVTEILADVDDPAERRRFLRLIENDVARMEYLLAGVREITTLDAKMPDEAREPIDLGELTQKIVDGFRRRYGGRVRFELDGSGVAPLVRASEERLTQVVENLLDNAASFSPEGGTVVVGVGVEDRVATLRVEDEGPGIPDEHLGRIFDRFFTWRPAAAKQAGHTGLGLAIVKAIVEAYGGSIRAWNRPGRGAAFEMRVPLA